MQKMPPKNEDIGEDQVLWQRVTQKVTPLSARRDKSLRKTPSRKSNSYSVSNVKKPIKILNPKKEPGVKNFPKSPIDLRAGDKAGLDSRTYRRLSRGNFPIERNIDLHGCTTIEAEVKLSSFIERALSDECRCLLVITGKGTGVLRAHVSRYLLGSPLSKFILALAEAHPTDGGNGAFYVLLRRHRK